MKSRLPRYLFFALLVLAAQLVLMQLVDRPVSGEREIAEVNISLAKQHVLPRYQQFLGHAAVFGVVVTQLCDSPPPRDIEPAKVAFQQVMDSWMAVEHIRHGSVILSMRNFRIHFWPSNGGRSARQIQRFVERQRRADLTPESFRSASVAVQGLPAAERLLFSQTYRANIVGAVNGDFSCHLLAAVAGNLVDIAAALVAGWSDGPGSFQHQIRSAGKPESRYRDHTAATADFIKGMYTTTQVMADLKLDRVLGRSIEKAKPRFAESWRSERSLRNLIVNLVALRALYEGEDGPGLKRLVQNKDPALAGLLSRAFNRTLDTARLISEPLVFAVVDPNLRPGVITLAKEVRALKELIRTRLPPAVDVALGFNFLDGD